MKKAFSILAILALSGCNGGNLKSQMGLTKDAPDEFTVISYPPLTVPPYFDLKDPNGARSAIVYPNIDKDIDAADRELLQKIKKNLKAGDKTNAKDIIDKEYQSSKAKQESKGLIRRTVDVLNPGMEKYAIDPEAEKARIQDNIQNNKPLSEGEIKTKKDSKSTLERLFSK